MSDLNFRALRSCIVGALVLAALVFVPAGSLAYWQGWAFIAIFAAVSGAMTIYLAIHDPQLLERRMRGGPTAEKQTMQKVIMSVVMAGFIALVVVPALDHRLGWSAVPAYVSLAGDLLIVLGFLFIFFVVRENSYGATTIQVVEGQPVISTGPYAIMRHPMYAGALPLLVGTPLALGSWWGLIIAALLVPALVWRLLEEERFLSRNLPGYVNYTRRVRTRLVPGIF